MKSFICSQFNYYYPLSWFFSLQFKTTVNDVIKPYHDDHFIVKWLTGKLIQVKLRQMKLTWAASHIISRESFKHCKICWHKSACIGFLFKQTTRVHGLQRKLRHWILAFFSLCQLFNSKAALRNSMWIVHLLVSARNWDIAKAEKMFREVRSSKQFNASAALSLRR